MIFVDEIEPDCKPWRGRITANNKTEIDQWFTGIEGYNRFITHYANLTKGYVDAFIIGSEMVGLTSFSDRAGAFPAVSNFVKLAGIVKSIVGARCLVSYAADWSEYHHTSRGWFNLDELFACRDIDFVGIDSYFPLTEDLPANSITEELIKKGWESGEGWDYYYTDNTRDEKKYFYQRFTKLIHINMLGRILNTGGKVNIITQMEPSYYFNLPPKYMYLEPADIITVTVDGVNHQMRIVKIDLGSNYMMKISAVAFEASIYDFYCPTDYLSHQTTIDDNFGQVANTILYVMDIVNISENIPDENEKDTATINFACIANANNWRGAIIYRSTDNGKNYKQIASCEQRATIGITLNKLPKAVEYLIDEKSELIVEIFMGGKLKQHSQESLMISKRLGVALIGDEIIQYENTELIEDNGNTSKYKLTTLFRGRFGTNAAIDQHEAGERFILLDSAVTTIKVPHNFIGSEITYKAVSIGHSLGSTDDSVVAKFEAVSLKPLAVANVKVTQDDSNDVIITWSRTDRFAHYIFWGESPMSEAQELYEIDITQDDKIIRTLKTDTIKAVYSKTDQKTDAIKAGTEYNITIYRISKIVGRGYGKKVSFTTIVN